MARPTFLYIGADKSGSTWLYRMLSLHHGVYVPEIKDIYFFDRHYDRGLSWYERFFEHGGGFDVRGEISHDYLYSEVAAERIARDLPGVRLIAFLRDPRERAFSAYLHYVRSGFVESSFTDAARRYPSIVDLGFYSKHVQRYRALFGDRFRVFFFHDLQRDPRAFASTVLQFIGAPFEDLPYEEKVLFASRSRLPVMARLARYAANAARRIGALKLLAKAKNSQLLGRVLYSPYDPASKPSLTAADAGRLTTLYEPDVRALEALLDVSLEHWRTLPAR